MKNRVLLTGPGGLIGRQAISALRAQGFTAVALGHCNRSEGADVTLQADLLDPIARRTAVQTAQSDHLLHLAWQTAPTEALNADRNRAWQGATVALVREFARLGGKRAVCVGSCAEYDWSFETLHETTPLAPNGPYGQAKADTGRELMAMAADAGLSLAWARVFFCYGPGERAGRLLGDLIAGLARGESVACTDGRQQRDFLHSGDVARALARILRSDLVGAINVGSGTATPVRQVIQETASQFGRPDLVRLGAIERAPNDPAKLVADISKLAELGFKPRFDIATGVADCIEQFRKNPAP